MATYAARQHRGPCCYVCLVFGYGQMAWILWPDAVCRSAAKTAETHFDRI